MPNWCENSVVIKGPASKVSELVAAIESQMGNDEGGVCSIIAPEPAEEDLPECNGIAPMWYSWRINNWGTKWDFEPLEAPTFVTIPDSDYAETEMSFDTAWAPPVELYRKLEQMGFEVTAFYHEPGMMFAGIYEDDCDEYYDYSDATSENVKEQLPEKLVDMFGIDSMLEEIEDIADLEEEDEE